MNCSETVIVEFIYNIVPQIYTICGRIYMQINSLPAGGAVVVGEIEVSPGNTVHKAELRSQTLLYQTLHARWNENDIQNFLKTVGFHQKYSDIKTPAGVLILKRVVLNQAFSPPPNHSHFRRRDLFLWYHKYRKTTL